MERRVVLQALGAMPLLYACGQRAPQSPQVLAGQIFPNFELPDLSGRLAHIRQEAAPLLINFWATWCAPCRAEMGGLDRLYREFRDAGLLVCGVSIDSDINLVREFVLQQHIVFPIFHDHLGALTQSLLGIHVFPTTLLVRRDGVIVEVIVGERAWDTSPARNAAMGLL